MMNALIKPAANVLCASCGDPLLSSCVSALFLSPFSASDVLDDSPALKNASDFQAEKEPAPALDLEEHAILSSRLTKDDWAQLKQSILSPELAVYALSLSLNEVSLDEYDAESMSPASYVINNFKKKAREERRYAAKIRHCIKKSQKTKHGDEKRWEFKHGKEQSAKNVHVCEKNLKLETAQKAADISFNASL